MREKVLILLLVGVCGSYPALAGESSLGRFDDAVYGFRVAVPLLGDRSETVAVQRFAAGGPAKDGFAPNCNVQIQFLKTDLAGYVDLSLREFGTAGLKLVERAPKKVSGLPATTIEYAGSLGGLDLHFLALVVAGKERFWLMTCTDLAANFEKNRAAFRQALDSFEVVPPGGREGR